MGRLYFFALKEPIYTGVQINHMRVFSGNSRILFFAIATIIFNSISLNYSRAAEQSPETARTIALVDELKNRLNDKSTRLDAMTKLIPYAVSELYKSSSFMVLSTPEQKKVIDRAYQAITPHLADTATLQMMLRSDKDDLQNLALRNDKKCTDGAWQVYPELVPELQYASEHASPWLRRLALIDLNERPDQREFVTARVQLETSPWVISQFTREDSLFNRRLAALLGSGSESVRTEALQYIATNGGSTARMFWRKFDLRTLNAALALTKAKSAAERTQLATALPILVDIDEKRVKEAVDELIQDPDKSVKEAAREAKKHLYPEARCQNSLEGKIPVEAHQRGEIEPIDKLQMKIAEIDKKLSSNEITAQEREALTELRAEANGTKPIPQSKEPIVCALGYGSVTRRDPDWRSQFILSRLFGG
jgi:hypothetical protein